MTTDGSAQRVKGRAPDGSVRRLISETSLYETAIGLYPILLGLILTDSLKQVATNIVDHPFRHADWSLRFLTVTLLLFSALWLHVWIATFRSMTVHGKPHGEHETLPGHKMKHVEGYRDAVIVFWLGVVQLLVFACMAYCVTRPKEFFVGSAVYSIILMLYTGVDIYSVGGEVSRNSFRHPWRSVEELWQRRYLPIAEDQLDRHIEGSNEAEKELLAQGRVFDLMLAGVVIGLSGGLYWLSSKYGAAWWIALLALILTSAAVVVDYYVYPYFYLV
jgi:hypothetical protein